MLVFYIGGSPFFGDYLYSCKINLSGGMGAFRNRVANFVVVRNFRDESS